MSHGDVSFTVECKRLAEAGAEQWIQIYRQVWMQCLDCASGQYSLFTSSAGPLRDVREYGFPDSFTPAPLAAAIDAAPLASFIDGLAKRERINCYVESRNIGVALLGGNLSGLGSLVLPELKQDFFIGRLIRNGLHAGAGQVMSYFQREGVPGVVAIWQAQPCAFPRLSRELERLLTQDGYRGVVGVLVHQMGNILQYQHPLWVASPQHIGTPLMSKVEQRIREAFQPHTYAWRG